MVLHPTFSSHVADRHTLLLLLLLPSALFRSRPAAAAKGRFDELVEEHGVRLLIDPAALMHVLGTKMDFVDEPLK